MIDPVTVAKEFVGPATGAAALFTDAGKKLITPLLENLGLALGDVGDIHRFYQRENLAKIFKKWAEARNQKPVTEEEIKKVLSLLRLASEQADDDLQERWAALMEHTATSTDGVLPSFGQTLSQLTSGEAKFLDRLFEVVMTPKPYNSIHPDGREPLERYSLVQVYDPSINFGVSWPERRLFYDQFTPEQVDNLAKMDQAELVFADVVRLGLVEEKVVIADEYLTIPRHFHGHLVDSDIAGRHIALHQDKSRLERQYALTPYGLSFIRAVAPKKSDVASE